MCSDMGLINLRDDNRSTKGAVHIYREGGRRLKGVGVIFLVKLGGGGHFSGEMK